MISSSFEFVSCLFVGFELFQELSSSVLLGFVGLDFYQGGDHSIFARVVSLNFPRGVIVLSFRGFKGN